MQIINNQNSIANIYHFQTISNQVNINITSININVQNNINSQNDVNLRMQLQWILIQLLFILLGGENTDEWHRVLNDYGRYVNLDMNNILIDSTIPQYSIPGYYDMNPSLHSSPSIPSVSYPPYISSAGQPSTNPQVSERHNIPHHSDSYEYNGRRDSREEGFEVVNRNGNSAYGLGYKRKTETYSEESLRRDRDAYHYSSRTGARGEIEAQGWAEVSRGNTSVRGEISGKAEGYAEISGRGTVSDRGLYGRTDMGVGVSGNASVKGEVKRGDVSAYGKVEVGASAEAKGSAEVIVGRGAYGEANVGASARVEEGIEGGLKIQDSGISAGVKKYAQAKAEAGVKFGYGTARDGDEIVSKGGAHVSAQASVSSGVDFHVKAENSDGYVKGSIGVEAGSGVGFSFGAGGEARINTKSWNVIFNSFVDLGIGLIGDLDLSAAVEGQISIKREISELRNELNQQIQQKEQQLLQNAINTQNSQAVNQKKVDKQPQIDRNKIRQKAKEIVLNNTSNWKSKLATIEKGFENKAKNILTDFSQKLIDKAIQRLERNETNRRNQGGIWSQFTNTIRGTSTEALRRIKGLSNIVGGLATKLLKTITPNVRTAIYEIKPKDVIKG